MKEETQITRCQRCFKLFPSDDDDAIDLFCGSCVNELLRPKKDNHIDTTGRFMVPKHKKKKSRAFSWNIGVFPK